MQGLHNHNHSYFQQCRRGISNSLKPIKWDPKDNKQVVMKYDGLMMIQKKKDAINNLNSLGRNDKYFQSVYWKDILGGKNSGEMIDKFLKGNKIDQFCSHYHNAPGAEIPSAQQLERMSVSKSKK